MTAPTPPPSRPDCRLDDFILESWRNAYCWHPHDPCPFGLPTLRGWRRWCDDHDGLLLSLALLVLVSAPVLLTWLVHS